MPLKVLGAGANVLVSDDGFDGVVVRLDRPAFRRVKQVGPEFELGGGVDLMRFARRCSKRGYSGLECMAGVPATVGGAVRMNAGGRHGEFSDVVSEVTVLAPDGSVQTWPRERVRFHYRGSDLGDHIVLSARIALREDDPGQVGGRFEELFAEKRRTQPIGEHSAGCIFKNPAGQSAGALIDRAGLKGAVCGAAVVSERHANFIVAKRGATASDVLRLIDVVRQRVQQAFGTRLETEVDIWRPQMAEACAP